MIRRSAFQICFDDLVTSGVMPVRVYVVAVILRKAGDEYTAVTPIIASFRFSWLISYHPLIDQRHKTRTACLGLALHHAFSISVPVWFAPASSPQHLDRSSARDISVQAFSVLAIHHGLHNASFSSKLQVCPAVRCRMINATD